MPARQVSQRVVDGRYQITGRLGAGGFATVYRARHIHIDREVALKLLKLDGADKGFGTRFMNEARIAARIVHPNVVTIYDFGFDGGPDGEPYIAMELLEGHDLRRELKRFGPLAPRRATRLFLPVLAALGEGHAARIVHKDLKPANLFLTNPGSDDELLKLLDFGVARAEDIEEGHTDAGNIMGTAHYVAPEYVQDHLVSPAIDVYQMGLIFIETLTGRPVVRGHAYDMIVKHCAGELDLPDIFTTGRLGAIFARALHRDPSRRYANCREFHDALESVRGELIDDRPLFNTRPTTLDLVVGDANLAGDANKDAPARRLESRRRPGRDRRLRSANTTKVAGQPRLPSRRTTSDPALKRQRDAPLVPVSDDSVLAARSTRVLLVVLFFGALALALWALLV